MCVCPRSSCLCCSSQSELLLFICFYSVYHLFLLSHSLWLDDRAAVCVVIDSVCTHASLCRSSFLLFSAFILICWCTQHETITIAPAKSATILNKSERTMSKSIIYYVNSMETQRFQPYTHSLFFNRVLEVTIDIIYGMSTISKRKTRDLLQFFSYCLTMSWLRFTIFIRAHI